VAITGMARDTGPAGDHALADGEATPDAAVGASREAHWRRLLSLV